MKQNVPGSPLERDNLIQRYCDHRNGTLTLISRNGAFLATMHTLARNMRDCKRVAAESIQAPHLVYSTQRPLVGDLAMRRACLALLLAVAVGRLEIEAGLA